MPDRPSDRQPFLRMETRLGWGYDRGPPTRRHPQKAGWQSAHPAGEGGIGVRRAQFRLSAGQIHSNRKGRFRRKTALVAAVTAIAWAAAFGITIPGPVTASARSRVAV